MNSRIKVLFLSSSPGRLRPDREIREIEERIRRAPNGSAFEIVSVWAVRTTDLTEALLRHMPRIVHFAGHGQKENGIFLEDEMGRPMAVSPATMCKLFEPLRGTTRVVILNACETRPIAEELRHLVDYVIAMRHPITDHAATVFSWAFYSALAHKQSVRSAFDLALAQLDLNQIPEADIPELFERPDITAPDPKKPRPRKRRNKDGATFTFIHNKIRDVINNE